MPKNCSICFILSISQEFLQLLSRGIYHHPLQMSQHILPSLPALCGQHDEDICNNINNIGVHTYGRAWLKSEWVANEIPGQSSFNKNGRLWNDLVVSLEGENIEKKREFMVQTQHWILTENVKDVNSSISISQCSHQELCSRTWSFSVCI